MGGRPVKKTTRNLGILLGVLGGYISLLLLLTLAESQSPDSSIRSIGDALWYSIVTISTVGYGDLYPVTWPGKLIGLLFVVLSVGALAFLVGAALQLMTGKLLPRLQMWLRRSKPWYLFSEYNEATQALAESIAHEDPQAVVLFPMTEQAKEAGWLSYPGTLLQAARQKKENCRLFFINNASGSNFAPALEAAALGHPVYCRTEQVSAACPGNLKLFNRYSCCARQYWADHPLIPGQRKLLLVGSGRYATALLEQGLLQNIFGPAYSTQYHLCGDWQDFLSNHPQLLDLLSSEGQDALVQHTRWNEDWDLILQADRILLCGDDEAENLSILTQLQTYFPTLGQIHLRTSQDIPGQICFGSNRQIYSTDFVIADIQAKTGRAMHEIYRQSYPDNAPCWEALNDFTRRSNLAVADHIAVKIRLLLQDPALTKITASHCASAYAIWRSADVPTRQAYLALEHQRWMRFHSLYNWRYSPVRNNAARLHPEMRPFEDLPASEQEKDAYSWQLLESVAAFIE